MNNKIIGSIIAIVLFSSGVLTGRYYFTKTDIKIIEKVVTETKYKYKNLKPENKPIFDQENFNRLLACYDSPLQFKTNTINNILNVKVYDDCKEATALYEIGTTGNYKIYLGIGAAGVI